MDLEPPAAARNLRKLLYLARHALEPEPGTGDRPAVLSSSGDLLVLEPESVWIDVDAFDVAARQALSTQALGDLEAAAARYAGELLPEDRYEEWAADRRDALAALHVQVLLALAAALQAAGAHDAASARLRDVLAADPAHEEAHRGLMRLYAARGDRQGALRQYRHCQAALQEHAGHDSSPATEVLRQKIEEMGVLPDPISPLPPPLPIVLQHAFGLPLVGRERALALLLDDPVLGQDDAGPTAAARRPVVMLGGEAGVGKTRLAAALAFAARERGAMVLWGACYGSVPYAPFVEALEAHLANLPEDARRTIAEANPEPARILPSLIAPANSPGDPQSEQTRLFAAVARLLSQLAGARPLVLLLDDLHVADVASLQLLHYLARLSSGRHWLIVATYRTEDMRPESELRTLASGLRRGGLSRQVDLLPLGRRECDRLASTLLGGVTHDGVLDAIYRLSLGNPLFVTELVGAMCAAGEVVREGGVWTLAAGVTHAVPSQVADLVAERVQALDESTRQALLVCAVAGMSFPTPLALRAIESAFTPPAGADAGLAALEAAVAAGLLEDQEGRYAFRHPLFREAIYARISASRRMRLHGAVGRVIESGDPADVNALAHHFARSADEEKAAIYLERAGDRARAMYANAAAEAQYRELAVRLHPHGSAADRARVGEKLGSVLITRARYDEALHVLEEAAALAQILDDAEAQARIAAELATAHAEQGSAREGMERVEATLPRLEGCVSPLALARLYLGLSNLAFAGGEYARLPALSDRILELADLIDDGAEAARVRLRSEVRRASGLTMLGDEHTARRLYEQALPLAERLDDLEALARIFNNLSHVCMNLGDFAANRDYMERAVAVAERIGDPTRLAVFRASLGQAYFLQNDLPNARLLIDRALADIRATPPSWHSTYVSYFDGSVAFVEGDTKRAEAVLTEVAALAEQNHDRQVLRVTVAVLAGHMLLSDPTAALARLEPLLDPDWATTLPDLDGTLVLAQAGFAWAGAGDAARSELAGTLAVRVARDRAIPLYLLETLYARGNALILLGRPDEAETVLEEALQLTRRLSYGWREASVRQSLAEALRRQGAVAAARRESQAAVALIRRLGGERATNAFTRSAFRQAVDARRRGVG